MSADVKLVLRRLGVEVAVERRSELWARCPAHEDEDPSWSIAWRGAKRGKHHCLACNWGGRLWELVALRLKYHCDEDLGEERARRWLGSEEFEEPRAEMPEEVTVRSSGFGERRFELPAGVVVAPLADWVTPARRYAEERGISGWQVERWGVGYAVGGRLDGRVVFPVRDSAGRLVNYMARTFVGAEKRYLYPASAEGIDYDALFGEERWPGVAERARSRVLVTEGAINALAVERVARSPIAALGGSGVRTMHVAKLSTFSEALVLTDPDEAGEGAAHQVLRALARVTRVVRVRLPEGRDAADVDPRDLRARIDVAVRGAA